MNHYLIIISVFLFSMMTYSQSTVPIDGPSTEPALFEPRQENVKIVLSEKLKSDSSISIFTNVTNLIIKNAILASNTVYSLLNWDTVNSKKTESVPAYKRRLHFGGWVRDSSNTDCYSTRAKVLIRDTLKPVTFKDNNCTVDSGKWLDPYSLETLKNAADMQIDHMVPLKDAYISGAYKWTYKARCLYGNYLGYNHHLIAAYGEENNQKGAQTPADYMPPNTDYKCTYLKNWLYIKGLWGLTMDTTEANAVKELINQLNCNISKMTISDKEIAQQTLFVNKNKDLCVDHSE